jgi:dienelactone hydrolase
MKSLVLGIFAVIAAAQPAPDSLPRRGYFGVALEQSPGGVRVTAVTQGSTAAEGGVTVGDMIGVIDGRTVDTTAALIGAIGRHRGGESITIGIVRDGEKRTIAATLKPYPPEQMENATISYGSVESLPSVRLRTIVSVPRDPSKDRFPAVLLLQGGGCGSIDTPIGALIGQPALMHRIGNQGFVTMRVEKSGVGDSQGEACDSIGYSEELAGYKAALKALQSHPAVDRERIYLLGISLGGVFAPIVAAETHVAGISVWGTPVGPPSSYPGRSERFFEEFAKVDVVGAWAKVNTRVQVLRGEFDANNDQTRGAHESLVAMLNQAHPGSAEFREFEALDHCWTRHESLEASKDKCGQGKESPELAATILKFLREGL